MRGANINKARVIWIVLIQIYFIFVDRRSNKEARDHRGVYKGAGPKRNAEERARRKRREAVVYVTQFSHRVRSRWGFISHLWEKQNAKSVKRFVLIVRNENCVDF